MKLYKTVGNDLSSWSDPDYVYRIGGTHRPTTRGDLICEAGLLHASPTPEGAGRYALEWPFRLLEVEGRPVVVDPDKVACRQLKVTGELPAYLCFGPQGERVVSVLDRIKTLTTDEIERLADAWSEAYGETWDETYDAAQNVARSEVWGTVVAAAVDVAWVAREVAWDTAWDAIVGESRDAARSVVYGAGCAAVRDAALACVVSDLVGQYGLKREHLDVLLKPWITVTGHDPLKGEL